MPRRNDRNSITIGPARLNAEQEIYQAVDRGAVTATAAPAVAPEEPGVTPGFEPGNLITPPALTGLDGYPILNSELFGTSLSPIAAGAKWGVFDATAQGLFPNSLFLNSASRVYNLDNPGQYVQIAAQPSFTVFNTNTVDRAGTISSGALQYDHTTNTWVYPSAVFSVPNGTITASFSPIGTTINPNQRALAYPFSSHAANIGYAVLYCNAVINGVSSFAHGFFSFNTTGDLNLSLMAYPLVLPSSNSTTQVWCTGVENNYAHLAYLITSPSTSINSFRINLNTGALEALPGNAKVTSTVQAFWTLTDGSLAVLDTAAVGGYHALRIVSSTNTVFVQATYMEAAAYTQMTSIGGGNGLQYAGQGGLLLPFNSAVGPKIRQLTPAGYLDVDMFTGAIDTTSFAWEAGQEGSVVRWAASSPEFGGALDWGLYQGLV